jgi:hypothetical protein
MELTRKSVGQMVIKKDKNGKGKISFRKMRECNEKDIAPIEFDYEDEHARVRNSPSEVTSNQVASKRDQIKTAFTNLETGLKLAEIKDHLMRDYGYSQGAAYAAIREGRTHSFLRLDSKLLYFVE